MEFYVPANQKELSMRKKEVWDEYCQIIQWGRENPIKFIEEVFGLKYIDYQAWIIMQSWYTPYCCWLECRGAGKDTKMAGFLMAKMTLIPNYKIYVGTLSSAQSAESFKKLEDIALKRIPSFRSATDIFSYEIEKNASNPTGFSHDKTIGYNFKLFNNSEMITLSSNLEAIRGKRGSIWFNEVGWQSAEAMSIMENFANVDSDFGTSTSKVQYYQPTNMPLQQIYTSSASDVSFPFYEKYKTFAKNMIKGDTNYFCCDVDAYDILYHSTIDGESIKSHLTEESIMKQIEEDSDSADRELFNKFRKGGGQDAVVSMDCLVRNSYVRKPELYNITGVDKYTLCYDTARCYDGSILGIFKLVNDKDKGYMFECVNVISMVDINTKKKTPLPMPLQLEIIKQAMIDYNGNADDWDNIELYIDAGSGGGGISGVADQLLSDWTDNAGIVHKGVIDAIHKQYESARQIYTKAIPIVHLVEPTSHKKIIYDALGKMTRDNYITFTNYNKKDFILVEQSNGEFIEEFLSDKEKIALTEIELMKTEISYIVRTDNPQSKIVTYGLIKEKQNTMHDDRAYVLALGGYALSLKRRSDLLSTPKVDDDDDMFLMKKPNLRKI